ncbi:hypothetical protein TNCV_2937921 [Trichonephila clavipes]|nr:hypothetical protein TNCV_2937921 [Trichonephila clavipes]
MIEMFSEALRHPLYMLNSTVLPPAFCDWLFNSDVEMLYERDTRSRWRVGQVCPDVDKELWRLGPDGSGDGKTRSKKETREKKKEDKKVQGEGRERKDKRVRERERAKPALNGEKGLSPEIGVKKTMNAGGVEYGNTN